MDDLVLIECDNLLLNNSEAVYVKFNKIYNWAPFEVVKSVEYSNLKPNTLIINFLFFEDISLYSVVMNVFLGKNINVIRDDSVFQGVVTRVVSQTVGFQIIITGNIQKTEILVNKKYSQQCRAMFAGSECGILMQNNMYKTQIKSIDGLKVILIDTPPSRYWVGGRILFLNGMRAMIREISGTEVLLYAKPSGIIGEDVSLMPSCNKSLEVCGNVYNNVVNFRGEPFI